MPPMPTVLIYGFDGFDPDVTINLFAAYRRMGFRPFTSRRLLPADVLCIERTPRESIDLPSYSAVHVFDYVCADNSSFMKSLQCQAGLTVMFPSAARRDEVLRVAPHLESSATVSLPPVAVDKWMAKAPSPRDFDIVHIGNWKPYYAEGRDRFAREFLSAITEENVQVWGRNWETHVPDSGRLRGRAPLATVSSIYRRSKVGLGMMYPYQRDRSISGRYWQGPINGTAVLSEPNSVAHGIPGVLEIDYSDVSRDAALAVASTSPSQLSIEASRYWRDQFDKSLATLSVSLGRVEEYLHRDRWLKDRSAIVALPGDVLRTVRRGLRL